MCKADHYKAMYAQHELEVVTDQGPVPCWRLARSYIYSGTFGPVVITATPEGVVIQCGNDSGRGKVSKMPLSDFVGELEARYLAASFLTKVWNRKQAEALYEDMIRKLDNIALDELSNEAGEIATDLRRLRDRDTSMFDSLVLWEKKLNRHLEDLVVGPGGGENDPLLDESEVYPALDYNEDAAARLVAIHDRFRTLFLNKYPRGLPG